MSDEFNRGRDLSRPDQLAAECRDLAQAMRQQQQAADGQSGLGGHPNPRWLYQRVEQVLTLSADLIVGVSSQSGPDDRPQTASPDPKSGAVSPENAGQAEKLNQSPGLNAPGTPQYGQTTQTPQPGQPAEARPTPPESAGDKGRPKTPK